MMMASVRAGFRTYKGFTFVTIDKFVTDFDVDF